MQEIYVDGYGNETVQRQTRPLVPGDNFFAIAKPLSTQVSLKA